MRCLALLVLMLFVSVNAVTDKDDEFRKSRYFSFYWSVFVFAPLNWCNMKHCDDRYASFTVLLQKSANFGFIVLNLDKCTTDLWIEPLFPTFTSLLSRMINFHGETDVILIKRRKTLLILSVSWLLFYVKWEFIVSIGFL